MSTWFLNILCVLLKETEQQRIFLVFQLTYQISLERQFPNEQYEITIFNTP